MTVDELHGIFIAYEMIPWQDEPSKKEATFKASKEPKKSKALSKNQSKDSNDEEALLVKNIKRGLVSTKGNYP